ncbi:MAG: hypothetical protein U1E13_01500 [Methylophilaceae bacterium]|nr:hypothetical protein [Methylophilaceae bacterium]
MNLKSLLQRLPFLGGTSSILVCETDGFHLHGAVISRDAGKLKIDFSARSDATEYRTAVKELVANLREQGWKGREAILLTPAVFSTLIELPISPKQPRTPLQMQELIRWEIEPLLLQHATLWSVGQMLQALGYMDEAQVATVLERQQGKLRAGIGDAHGSNYSFKRFCEIALEMGFIDQAKIDECLARQSWLRSEDDEFSCGWVAQEATGNPHAAEEMEASGSYPWLVSGANIGVMRQWEAAFATHKVVLNEVYPLVGCALEQADIRLNAIILESLHGMASGIRLEFGVVTAIKTQQSRSMPELDACLENYHELTVPSIEMVYLAVSDESARGLAQQLSEMIGREVEVLPTGGSDVSAGMLGAATVQLLKSNSHHVASVSVRGPKPPIFRRVEVRAIAAAVLICMVIAILELSLYVRKDLAQAEHTKVAEAKKEFDAVVANAQARVDQVTKLQADIKAKDEELAKLMARFDFFAIELPARNDFVRTLLNELVNNVTEDVVINAVEETPTLGFRIAGWALSETAAQQFIQSFKNAMAPLEMDVTDPLVRSQSGRLGLLGYDLHFRLVSTRVAEPVDTATPAATQPARRQRSR